MFEPKADRIRELSEIYPERIKELETIFSGRTNVYIDFANVMGWQEKLGWHVEIRNVSSSCWIRSAAWRGCGSITEHSGRRYQVANC